MASRVDPDQQSHSVVSLCVSSVCHDISDKAKYTVQLSPAAMKHDATWKNTKAGLTFGIIHAKLTYVLYPYINFVRT